MSQAIIEKHYIWEDSVFFFLIASIIICFCMLYLRWTNGVVTTELSQKEEN